MPMSLNASISRWVSLVWILWAGWVGVVPPHPLFWLRAEQVLASHFEEKPKPLPCSRVSQHLNIVMDLVFAKQHAASVIAALLLNSSEGSEEQATILKFLSLRELWDTVVVVQEMVTLTSFRHNRSAQTSSMQLPQGEDISLGGVHMPALSFDRHKALLTRLFALLQARKASLCPKVRSN